MSIKKNKIKKIRYIEIDHDMCHGCGLCQGFICARDVYYLEENEYHQMKAHADDIKCVGCCFCELLCPHQALHVDGGFH